MEYEAENKEMELRTVKSKIKERRFLRYVFDSVLGHPFRGHCEQKMKRGKHGKVMSEVTLYLRSHLGFSGSQDTENAGVLK